MDKVLRAYHAGLGIAPSYPDQTRLPFHESPAELREIGPDCFGRPQQLRPDAAMAWAQMKQSAATDGIALEVVSAYRSPKYQVEVIQRQLDAGQAIEDILTRVAAPGFSEHHSGCALDITTTGFEAVEESFEDSDAFAWLVDNAAQFGFHLSYPRNNPYGVVYEPWHWCYRD